MNEMSRYQVYNSIAKSRSDKIGSYKSLAICINTRHKQKDTALSIDIKDPLHNVANRYLLPNAWKQNVKTTTTLLNSFLTQNPKIDVRATSRRKQAPAPISSVTAFHSSE